MHFCYEEELDLMYDYYRCPMNEIRFRFRDEGTIAINLQDIPTPEEFLAFEELDKVENIMFCFYGKYVRLSDTIRLEKIQKILDVIPPKIISVEINTSVFFTERKHDTDDYTKYDAEECYCCGDDGRFIRRNTFKLNLPEHILQLSLSVNLYDECDYSYKFCERLLQRFFIDFFDRLPVTLRALKVNGFLPKIVNPPPALEIILFTCGTSADKINFSDFITIGPSLKLICEDTCHIYPLWCSNIKSIRRECEIDFSVSP